MSPTHKKKFVPKSTAVVIKLLLGFDELKPESGDWSGLKSLPNQMMTSVAIGFRFFRKSMSSKNHPVSKSTNRFPNLVTVESVEVTKTDDKIGIWVSEMAHGGLGCKHETGPPGRKRPPQNRNAPGTKKNTQLG